MEQEEMAAVEVRTSTLEPTASGAWGWLDRLRRTIRRLLVEAEYDLEMFGATAALLLGVFLLLPLNTFGSSPVYATMQQWLPEWGWGILMVAVGSFQLVGVVQDWSRWRSTSAFVLIVVYGFWALTIAHASPPSTGWPIYTLFAFAQFIAYLRIGEVRRG